MKTERVVLITGASMGLGRATADLLAASGWRVFGTSRHPEQEPQGWELLALDVTDEDSVAACVAEVMARAGRIDALVNSAGYGLKAMAEEPTVDEVRAQFDVNYVGVPRMCRAVLPIMRAQGRGHIVNISSLSGLIGTPPSAHYAATKHALEAYADTMKYEVARFGVQVAIVEPGSARTCAAGCPRARCAGSCGRSSASEGELRPAGGRGARRPSLRWRARRPPSKPALAGKASAVQPCV